MKWGSVFLLVGLLALWAGLQPASGRVSPAFCRLPKDYGPCKEILLRFYYNPAIGTCQTFIYGGCHGNTNNFMTYRQCVNTCRLRLLGLSLPRPDAARSIAAPGRRLEDRSRVKPSICFLPVAPGPCQAYGPSFYYNAATGQCLGFNYGGCRGNGNRFGTEKECLQTCG
ncbi:kunitz-type serine protease inhibitor 5 [Alligator mississippiensis]|uniref:kunitz-type serine protease inhibitor 5 n=1 Tax=Alligator mississippiensis TaxID=8496 RepID=UPI0028777C34|nr:kunitz-type serine protease inhibitor 5 [Alligator mississippiensis]XP_059569027.1 kunitz-type serine protease inhibitor 5 [Alligator mississippiensis]